MSHQVVHLVLVEVLNHVNLFVSEIEDLGLGIEFFGLVLIFDHLAEFVFLLKSVSQQVLIVLN
jgi:hypothetical protein